MIQTSRDTVVGIATGYGLDDRGVPIQSVSGAIPPGVKRPEHEAEHSPPTSTEVKKMLIYPYIHSLIRHHCVVLN
jgi:hypothetical protein